MLYIDVLLVGYLTIDLVSDYNMVMPKKQTTIEDLAIMVKKGFDGVDKKFDEARKDRESLHQEVNGLRQEMREGFKRVDARFDVLEGDIKDFVTRDEFEDLLSRVRLVEKTLELKV
jgi:hypothetical protein